MNKVIIRMPYESDINVKNCFAKNNEIKKHVRNWLMAFQAKLGNALRDNIPKTAAIEIDLAIVVPQRKGKLPDTHNYRELILHSVGKVVGYDDWTFAGHWYPARRVEADEEPTITVTIRW